ncbi:hypothetical protein VNO77_19884 [Canavalia gladiata]|uniref:Uncharacterized protein n=1 Tax=Canavalia gladiata TaxID=3824 RepID=A0AAN9QKT7_CANGL
MNNQAKVLKAQSKNIPYTNLIARLVKRLILDHHTFLHRKELTLSQPWLRGLLACLEVHQLVWRLGLLGSLVIICSKWCIPAGPTLLLIYLFLHASAGVYVHGNIGLNPNSHGTCDLLLTSLVGVSRASKFSFSNTKDWVAPPIFSIFTEPIGSNHVDFPSTAITRKQFIETSIISIVTIRLEDASLPACWLSNQQGSLFLSARSITWLAYPQSRATRTEIFNQESHREINFSPLCRPLHSFP